MFRKRSRWPIGNKLRAVALELFVKLLSFPMNSIPFRELVAPERRCATCASRLLTTLDRARVHARATNGLAMEATPTLHRCLRCHELTVFPSFGEQQGVALPFDQRDEWLERMFPGMHKC